MKTEDRELLELAAKAAGFVELRFDPEGKPRARKENGVAGDWSPLEDDGDALRLAIALDIHVKRYSGSTTAQEVGSLDQHTEHDHWPINGGDPMASTRRAITWAAAKIGRSLP